MDEQLAELGRILEAAFPGLVDLPPHPTVEIRAVRWSRAQGQALFDLVGVEDGALYAEGRIEATGPASFVVWLEENPDRPDRSPPSPVVHVESFNFIKGEPVGQVIDRLARCALNLGLTLRIGEADSGQA